MRGTTERSQVAGLAVLLPQLLAEVALAEEAECMQSVSVCGREYLRNRGNTGKNLRPRTPHKTLPE